MRSLTDQHQQHWHVDVLFASFGAYYLVFSADPAGEVRKLAIAADSQNAARQHLNAMSDADLCAALDESIDFHETSALGL